MVLYFSPVYLENYTENRKMSPDADQLDGKFFRIRRHTFKSDQNVW